MSDRPGYMIEGCSRERCGMTGGYYVGGGRWLCWFHAIAHGLTKVVAKLQFQALP